MMPQLLETILSQDGMLKGLAFHQQRVSRSAQAHGVSNFPDLQTLQVPEFARKGRFKCRVLYRHTIENVEFIPYNIREIHRLKLVQADHINYGCKYADRKLINEAFQQRGAADDILMVKNGLLTDTSYANIALWDGAHWWTPEQPLLAGTRRAQLLAGKRICPAIIKADDLDQFTRIALFNAMMDLEEGPVLPLTSNTVSL